MVDSIIIAAVILIGFFAIRSTVKRIQGKRSCCGGSGYVAKSRKLPKTVKKTVFQVEGMHCQNCANRVIEDVQNVPQASAAVNLKKGTVTVSLAEPVDDEIIRAAIEKGGYQVTGMNQV